MSDWTIERVLAMAPDSASIGPARELASPAKWVACAGDGKSTWGEAKGSGARPYQVAVDLNGPAYKCSCPSRKIPCKHVLGLLLRLAANQVEEGEPPGWVTEWLSKREERATPKAAVVQKGPADEKAAAKRVDDRWKKIAVGLDECEAFLADVAGQGLLAAQSARSWDQMAARMIDAQAPGLARRLKRCGRKIGIGPDWGAAVAGELGGMALLIEATRRIEVLDELSGNDIRATLGIPIRKEDLSGDAVVDDWDVLGEATELEDRLTTYRAWLKGRTTGRWAMHLAFSIAGQPPGMRPAPGTAFSGGVEYYPSAWPLRASIGPTVTAPFAPAEAGTWEDAFDGLALALASHPWLENIPVTLTQGALAQENGRWWVIDGNGAGISLRRSDPFKLLAVTGNMASNLFGEFDGVDFHLLGAWGPWGFLPI